MADVVEAIPLLEEAAPLLMILEGRLEAEGMSPLLEKLAFKQDSDSAPPTIYLTSDGTCDPTDYRFNAVVKMPVTTETLQPVIDRIAAERHR